MLGCNNRSKKKGVTVRAKRRVRSRMRARERVRVCGSEGGFSIISMKTFCVRLWASGIGIGFRRRVLA
jgi:hypothetical protein